VIFVVLTINSERPVGILIIGKFLLFVSEAVVPHFCRLKFSFTSAKETSIEAHGLYTYIYIIQDGNEMMGSKYMFFS
jgi:hypothetical protein